MSQSLINQGYIPIYLKKLKTYTGKRVAIPYKSGIYSNAQKQALTLEEVGSQSLINQGYIPIGVTLTEDDNTVTVAIPYKSGIYSNLLENGLWFRFEEDGRNPL